MTSSEASGLVPEAELRPRGTACGTSRETVDLKSTVEGRYTLRAYTRPEWARRY